MEFTKNNKDFKNKIFSNPRFGLEKIEFYDINIDELVDI